jgi:hypothetical protein
MGVIGKPRREIHIPVTEPAPTVPVTEPMIEPAREPASEPVSEPMSEPVPAGA